MKIRRKHPVRVNHLGSDPIPQLVRRLALPAMLAQFVNVLYSIIDRMYIGNIANVGDIALAGVGICGPIVTMISAFAAWIGNGARTPCWYGSARRSAFFPTQKSTCAFT